MWNQIANDWQRVPFVEIEVTDDFSCQSENFTNGNYSAVFERVWYGFDEMCDCRDARNPHDGKMTKYFRHNINSLSQFTVISDATFGTFFPN